MSKVERTLKYEEKKEAERLAAFHAECRAQKRPVTLLEYLRRELGR